MNKSEADAFALALSDIRDLKESFEALLSKHATAEIEIKQLKRKVEMLEKANAVRLADGAENQKLKDELRGILESRKALLADCRAYCTQVYTISKELDSYKKGLLQLVACSLPSHPGSRPGWWFLVPGSRFPILFLIPGSPSQPVGSIGPGWGVPPWS
ncbi:hypothetical protein HPB50_004972 [Hyalomma asiaticum]|uniref:Uncharacterized protein n=1 Tax=Hyalomma asiaticum TaxID=266040 RepID=A0ACB7TCU3_HYAAI|nr:hypothetical protein HPB50_004972 [Hyalomma asiaticum]